MKGPLDGPIVPGGEPEPTEAEFRAEWAKLRAVLEPFYGKNAPEPELDDVDTLASLRRMNLIETFVRRHMRRARAMGLPAESFLDEAAAMRPQILKAHEDLERATEALLHASSDVADERVKKAEKIMAMVAELKRTWPTMTAEAREEWIPSLQRWKEKREQWLSAIPLEERQRLEATYQV